jgi:hypothetical protein
MLLTDNWNEVLTFLEIQRTYARTVQGTPEEDEWEFAERIYASPNGYGFQIGWDRIWSCQELLSQRLEDVKLDLQGDMVYMEDLDLPLHYVKGTEITPLSEFTLN